MSGVPSDLHFSLLTEYNARCKFRRVPQIEKNWKGQASAALRRAVEHLSREGLRGGGGQSALARICGVKQGHVWRWLNTPGALVPAEHVLKIERATDGKVSRRELRPDVFDEEKAAA